MSGLVNEFKVILEIGQVKRSKRQTVCYCVVVCLLLCVCVFVFDVCVSKGAALKHPLPELKTLRQPK